MRQLQQAADDAGVEIASMQFGAPEVVQGAPETGDPNTVVASINASVSLEGRYFQIADFMRRVEAEVPRAVLVSQLGLGEGGEEGFPTLAGDWTGDLFAIVPTDQAQDAGDGGSGGSSGAGDGSDGADNGGGDLPEGEDDELQEAAG